MAALEKSRDSDNDPSFVGRRLDDITDVWPLLSIPQENQGFIARFVSQMDVVSFVVRLNYVKAERRSPGASLRINSGFTEGFRSEAEVLEFVGTVERWENRRGLWSISHPRSQRRTRDAVARQEPRTWGTCPTCFQLLPATGHCDNCEG